MRYSEAQGQYVDDRGRFVKYVEVLKEVARETRRLTAHITVLSLAHNNGRLSANGLTSGIANELKKSMIRMYLLGAGGKDQRLEQLPKEVKELLRDQINRLREFGVQIAKGNLSPQEINRRAILYAQSATTLFHIGEKQTRLKENRTLARRKLDSQAQHCASCPKYSTGGKWILAKDIVPPGVNCQCGGRCKCFVEYKRAYEVKTRLQ